jgi:GH15 family glucan-1,4-alpha-glucosidase
LREDGYLPIRDYAAIGDGRTVALVGLDGSIDWLCLPRVDSPAVFARILDAERGGSFRLEPAEPFEAERRYQDDSNVLETTFRTASGTVRVTDAMTLVPEGELAPLREIVRRIEGLSGTVPMRWRLEPRFGFGRQTTKIDRRGGYFMATCGRDALALGTWDAGDPAASAEGVEAEFSVEPGKTALLSLTASHQEPALLPGREDTERRLRHTAEFWPRWTTRSGSYDGPWRDAVLRSVLALKMLVFAPSGAIVAAPTTSLPEEIGGMRNWDYRFNWLRDAAWAIEAFLAFGCEAEAHAFFWWLMHASARTRPELDVLYRVDGSTGGSEEEIAELAGYRGSRPVRAGNGAMEQSQHDIYGAVLHTSWRHFEHHGDLGGESGRSIARIADHIAEIWQRPDSGIWEVRSEPSHFTQSKALCCIGLDRAVALAERDAIPDRSKRWRGEASRIRSYLDERCWDDERGSYVRAVDMRELDASLLTLPLLGYDDAKSPRMRGTIDAIRRELADGPFVYRYRGGDGVAGGEGAFLPCSFWLAEALAHSGRVDEAATLMDDLVGLANDVGLYSEEIDPASGAFLGNFPQGLTHLALVNAAIGIGEAQESA